MLRRTPQMANWFYLGLLAAYKIAWFPDEDPSPTSLIY
jgi:hypothetical protein